MSQVAAPADRRFRRVHVKPARYRPKWRAFAVPASVSFVVVIVVAMVALRGRPLLARSSFLQVDRIVVRGNERLSKGEVMAMLDGLRGESLFGTDLDVWRTRLLASPWVRDAALRRSLPSTVEVAISERIPAGIGRVGGELYLVDERGVLIDQYGPQYADLDLPVIDGLSMASSDGSAGDAPRAELASRIMMALRARPDLASKLSQIDVTDLHNASVILSGDPAVIYLGDDNFVSRLQLYVDLASALRERVPSIDYVDLRFDDRIYVRPAGGGRAAEIPSKAVLSTTKKARPQTKRP
ncbi:MAG TPA: FtsQ-type POTRA domain-containing protein [Vicinamibacterales bacterium]|nr:FtsQ-type POTRA domain-containing protein [Vicinamibacterales bacterium]